MALGFDALPEISEKARSMSGPFCLNAAVEFEWERRSMRVILLVPTRLFFALAFLGVALFAGRIAFRNKLIARGRGLLLVVVGYVVDRRAGRAVKFHALGVEHVFLRPI